MPYELYLDRNLQFDIIVKKGTLELGQMNTKVVELK